MSLISYRPVITQTSGLITHDVAQDDAMLVFNSGAAITDPIEVAFPSNPTEGQVFGLSTVWPINDLTLSAQYYPIVEPVTSLAPSAPKLWAYSFEIGKWIVHP